MGLITETNAQYYSGQQTFPNLSGSVVNPTFNCTFETDVISAFNKNSEQIKSASNYTIYLDGVDVSENLSYVSDPFSNIITLNGTYGPTSSIYIQLKKPAVAQNYGNYEYTTLDNVINNFLVAYVGEDKLITKIKRTDVMFHAKRGLQEFSYDTLKSIKSQELTVPPSLGVPIPQDYVNYVRCSWIDGSGVQHIIYPVNNLTSSPFTLPIQDESGIAIQDSFSNNINAEQSLTEQKWNTANDTDISGAFTDQMFNEGVYDFGWEKIAYGQRYGLNPETSQMNGWFQINEREGKFTFSSDLAGKLIILEYISDGLAYDFDSKIPKMAEDALYSHINHSILSTKQNVPEYIVLRYKRERSAKLRNAKIRLSNIKLDEIVQVMRGKSKWIKS
tara:strand:+ start:954 stop:2120 length:1167 start_codon:yes stop_codon:yes gene_type:complete